MQSSVFAHLVALPGLSTQACKYRPKWQANHHTQDLMDILQNLAFFSLFALAGCGTTRSGFAAQKCDSASLRIEVKQWEKTASAELYREFATFDAAFQRNNAYLEQHALADIKALSLGPYFENTLEKARSAVPNPGPADYFSIVSYFFEGETAEEISVVLWSTEKQTAGVFIDQKDSLHVISGVGNIYRILRKQKTSTHGHLAIPASRILLTEVDCAGEVWIRFIFEPDDRQESLLFEMFRKGKK